ncbi:FMO [Acanthosepion pharaonis]|uniref:Flavin-containing monooxygenase n=1 Tax=Acanthosepion pharaonis TaxID=158019 RepID=A0A812C805_ACAPH|nr:FMO [Sepia pharaonis]
MYTFGAAAPLHESQCRLATRVFKGLVKLPPKEVMLEEINATLDTQRSVDVIGYQDELCELIGCKPKLCELLLSDPYLGLNAIVGPCTPYQFRLTGPGKWAGARSAILDQWKQMHYPTNKHLKSNLSPWIKDFLIAFGIFFVMIQFLVFGIFLSK